ncbi:MAG: HU family DNA-binding protein [Defluviitaleaceae bacterium]|nr:HU family DNA-binding protein [Defluviitaleaceae bacterium]
MSKNFNKADLISAIAEKTGLTKKDTEKTIKAFEDVVTDALTDGGKVQLVGFGTFDVSERKARVGRNPQTNKPMDIPASTAPRFKAGKVLKDAVNKK